MSRQEWVQAIAVLAFVAGLVLWGFLCYRVVLAGGLASTSARPTCNVAANGRTTPGYRADESLRIRRGYLPPSAVCEWSGGTTAALVPANALSWAGPVLVVGAAATGVGMLTTGARRRHRHRHALRDREG